MKQKEMGLAASARDDRTVGAIITHVCMYTYVACFVG